ncbi:WD40 repeat-like protein [Trametes sanguinea]|nr:WD40 repeat-like protein [Trametes sanguinea]
MGEHADDLVTDVKAVAVSPTKALILAVFKEEWRLWDVSNGRWIRTGKYARSGRTIVAWSSSGNLFACTDTDHDIRFWEVQTGKLVGSFAGHSKEVTAVVFTADEQHLLSASRDGSIRRWKVQQTPQETSCDVLFQSERNDIDAFCVSSDGQWLLSGSSQLGSPPDTSSADLLAKPSRQPVNNDYYGIWYSALRLHDATGRVVWIEHHPSLISSLSLSEDCTRALTGNREGEVFLYDLTQLIPPDKSARRSPPPLAVPEYRFSSGSTRPALHVSFAPGDEGIITERSYTPLSPDLQPLSRRTTDASPLPTYFVDDDGWLWRVNPTLSPHRICWLSLSFRPTGPEVTRAWRSQHGYGIACLSPEGRLVVIDTSQALRGRGNRRLQCLRQSSYPKASDVAVNGWGIEVAVGLIGRLALSRQPFQASVLLRIPYLLPRSLWVCMSTRDFDVAYLASSSSWNVHISLVKAMLARSASILRRFSRYSVS